MSESQVVSEVFVHSPTYPFYKDGDIMFLVLPDGSRKAYIMTVVGWKVVIAPDE